MEDIVEKLQGESARVVAQSEKSEHGWKQGVAYLSVAEAVQEMVVVPPETKFWGSLSVRPATRGAKRARALRISKG